VRRAQGWAWWTCWIGLSAALGYTFTFGVRDATIRIRALVADVLLPAALLPTPRTCSAAPADRGSRGVRSVQQ